MQGPSTGDRIPSLPQRFSRYAPAASAIVCAGIMVVGFAELGGASTAPTARSTSGSVCHSGTTTGGTTPTTVTLLNPNREANALAASKGKPRTVTVTRTKTVTKTKTIVKCGTKTVTRTGPGRTTTVYTTSPGETKTVTTTVVAGPTQVVTETVTEKGTVTVTETTTTVSTASGTTTTETYTTTLTTSAPQPPT